MGLVARRRCGLNVRRMPALLDRTLLAAVLSLGFIGTSSAQGVLDVLDGETLYEGGSLVTLGFEMERGETLRAGRDRIDDPADTSESTLRTTFAWQYGLRHDLQLGIAVPFVRHARDSDIEELVGSGLGDVELLAKWRVFRWDAPGKALNVALLGQLSLPTGEDDAESGGLRHEPELQAGSGGLDPALGLGVTHEPGRWRFNAAALHRWRTDSDGDGFALGDEFVAELAVGNRFWLEPYPGPFMRADLVFRWYHEARSETQPIALPLDSPLRDSGGDRATLGLNWAFRPRPALDLQLGLEVPIWQDVHGTQVGEDWALDLSLGFRF